MTYLKRCEVGFIDGIPQKAGGHRALPPMSLPMPNGDPPPATRQLSPPDEPPGVRSLFNGCVVKPQMGLLHPKLWQSKFKSEDHTTFQPLGATDLIMVWGTLVRQKGTAPSFFRATTRAASLSAGLLMWMESPVVES